MKTKIVFLVLLSTCLFTAHSQSVLTGPSWFPGYKPGKLANINIKDSVSVTTEVLLKYCGNYQPAPQDRHLIPMSIVLKGGCIYRRLTGDSDRRLVPTSSNTFEYADGSGRKLEFLEGKNGQVYTVVLSRRDGEFLLEKTEE